MHLEGTGTGRGGEEKNIGIPLKNDIRNKKFFVVLKNSDSMFFSL